MFSKKYEGQHYQDKGKSAILGIRNFTLCIVVIISILKNSNFRSKQFSERTGIPLTKIGSYQMNHNE
jgi:hypothetical protein